MCRLIYVEKRLYIHDAGGKKVDMSHNMTTKLTTTNCHQVGSRRQFDMDCPAGTSTIFAGGDNTLSLDVEVHG